MAFPNDLSNVVVFKVHPAIGIARISMNDDYYVFGRDPEEYRSHGLLKRQAVRFRVFAYGEGLVGLGELTEKVMADLGVKAVWSARVANRKIARLRGTPLDGMDFVISASASSDDDKEGRLVGSLPTFKEGAEIPLGQITPEGIFIPPKGGVFRQTPGEEVPGFPATSDSIADTTCDGTVSVRLTTCEQEELPTLPACIIVAPPDFSPDTDPVDDNGRPSTLLHFLRETLITDAATPFGNLHQRTAREIDEAALRPCTQAFDPGFEVCFEDARSEVPDTAAVFYRAEQEPATIDPGELRVRYKSGPADQGAVPGQLTSGLCSPWQGDFTACVGYWSEHLPNEAFVAEDSSTVVRVFRKEYANQDEGSPTLSSAQEFVDHVDKVGVLRLREGKRVETERANGDDIP